MKHYIDLRALGQIQAEHSSESSRTKGGDIVLPPTLRRRLKSCGERMRAALPSEGNIGDKRFGEDQRLVVTYVVQRWANLLGVNSESEGEGKLPSTVNPPYALLPHCPFYLRSITLAFFALQTI